MTTTPPPEGTEASRLPGMCPMHGERVRYESADPGPMEPGCTCERVRPAPPHHPHADRERPEGGRMRYPHIATGRHMEGADPRFRINTAPGVMHGVNEAHGSYLQHHHVVELRDELNEWLAAHPTAEEAREAERRRWWQEGHDAAMHARADSAAPACPTTDDREALARAMYEAGWAARRGMVTWDSAPQHIRTLFGEHAETALAVLRGRIEGLAERYENTSTDRALRPRYDVIAARLRALAADEGERTGA